MCGTPEGGGFVHLQQIIMYCLEMYSANKNMQTLV